MSYHLPTPVDAIIALAATTTPRQAPDPDRAIRVGRAFGYPNQVWYFIASFITLLALKNVVSILGRRFHYRCTSAPSRSITDDTSSERPRRSVSIARIPIALVHLFRVGAFRITASIGGGHSINGAEMFLTAAYAAVVYTWAFVNSPFLGGFFYISAQLT